MRASCTKCGKALAFDDSKFGQRPSVKVRCPACKAVVTLTRPAAGQAEVAANSQNPTVAPAPQIATPAIAPGGVAESVPAPGAEGQASQSAIEPKGPPTLKIKRHAIAVSEDLVEEIPPLPRGLRVSLAVLTGSESGKVFPCARSRAVIGRAGTDVPLEDDEVSRRHALLEIHEDRYILKDLGSTNGTFVDERRITEMEIPDRGEFRVGSSHIMLIITPLEEM
jgi:phage FluMu protein Com